MRTVTIVIPLKANSSRVKHKNFRSLAGLPLFIHATTKAQAMQKRGLADELAIFGSHKILQNVPPGFSWYREMEDKPRACSNDMFFELAACCATDFVMILNATSPFLRHETIERAIRAVQTNDYDSACSVVPLRGRLWDAKYHAINHDPATCPRTQDQQPLYIESDGFWIAPRSLFIESHRRVGYKPAFIEVNGIEAIDIDTEADWELAEAAAKTWRVER